MVADKAVADIPFNELNQLNQIIQAISPICDETFYTLYQILNLVKKSPLVQRRLTKQMSNIKQDKIKRHDAKNIAKILEIKKIFSQINNCETDFTLFFSEKYLKIQPNETIKHYVIRLKYIQGTYTNLLIQANRNLSDILNFYISQTTTTDTSYTNTDTHSNVLYFNQSLLNIVLLIKVYSDDAINSYNNKHSKIVYFEMAKKNEELVTNTLNKVEQLIENVAKTNDKKSKKYLDFLIRIYNENQSSIQKNLLLIDNQDYNEYYAKQVIQYILLTPLENVKTQNATDKCYLETIKKVLSIQAVMQKIFNDNSADTIFVKDFFCQLTNDLKKEKNHLLKQYYLSNINTLREIYALNNQKQFEDSLSTNKIFNNIAEQQGNKPENQEIISSDDFFAVSFRYDLNLLFEKRPSIFQSVKQNEYDENKAVYQISRILSDKNKITHSKDFSEIEKIINDNKPSFFKWWRRKEYNRYTHLEYNAKLIFVLEAFNAGQIDEVSVIANINLLATKHPNPEIGIMFEQISENIRTTYEQKAADFIKDTENVPATENTINSQQNPQPNNNCEYSKIYCRLNKKIHPVNNKPTPPIKRKRISSSEEQAQDPLASFKQWITQSVIREEKEIKQSSAFKL